MKKVALALALACTTSLMAADGAALYKKCAGCHGGKGERKALNKSEVIKGMDKAKLVESMKAYKAGTLNKKGMGALMKGQMAAYNDAQIEAIADFLSKQ